MIKKILVALDPDSDTPVATQFAAEIAERYKAAVTGLAVVDMGHIESGARGGGIGSMYYAEKLRENLTEEARTTARELTHEFEEALEGTGLSHGEHVKEGVPFQRIVEDMKYHDLLVVGQDPHFFYSHPEHKTDTLARVVKKTVAPTLVVRENYQPVTRVLIAYDGSAPSARTMQQFAHLKPFGTNLRVELINIHEGENAESELILQMAAAYLKSHGFETHSTSIRGDDPADQICTYVESSKADLVVAGAHSVSMLKKLAFGSTTASLLERCPAPIFVYH